MQMKIHQQFDLNLGVINELGKDSLVVPPHLIEELITKLTKRGYTILKSSTSYMGLPQSITLVKDFTEPFVAKFSAKTIEDFNAISRALGIDKLFE